MREPDRREELRSAPGSGVFSHGAQLALKVALIAVAGGAVAGLFWAFNMPVTQYDTWVDLVREQPVPFSHKHHVGGLGLDCRYCHTTVEKTATAGMPPSYTCMTCHSELWTNAAILAPIRLSLAEDKPMEWHRVYRLPDYVYFNHSIHIAKGVGCSTCHGPVDRMPLMWKANTLLMQWCVDCHRDPGHNLRPKNQIFNPDWHRDASTPSPSALMASYHVGQRDLTDCSICHR